MRVSRPHRLITLLVAVAAILFGQLALAGYSCPGAARAAEVARMTEAGLPCAQEMSKSMDDAQPGFAMRIARRRRPWRIRISPPYPHRWPISGRR